MTMVELVPHRIATLVFSGGGMRAGPLYAGCLARLVQELPDLDYTSRHCTIRRVRGVSMGAIVALFVAMRVAPEELCAFAMEVPNEAFMRWDFQNLLTHYGFNRAEGVQALLTSLMQTHLRNPDPTFAALLEITGIALEVVATDVERQSAVVFSPEATPQQRVSEAVLASTAIPFFFAPRRIVTAVDARPHCCIDGAVTLNYPQHGLDPATALGFHVVVPPARGSGDGPAATGTGARYQGFLRFVWQFIRLLTSFGDAREYVIPTVRVPLPDDRQYIMALEPLDRANLISQGHQSVVRFLATATVVGRSKDAGTQTGP
ncbi:MAG: patatin-like phospholipase family protein [Pseudomonadota bacterium]